MKNYVLPFLSVGVLLAGCTFTSPSSPVLALADAAISTKDLDTSLTEMTMMESFQTTGRLGQLPMGFDVIPGDEAVANEVLLLQETLGWIHETMQEVQAIRFHLVLEGDVFKTLALSFQEQSLQFSEIDAATFNDLTSSFLSLRGETQEIQNEARSIRQRMFAIVREMNRPRTFDATQVATLQTLADSLFVTLEPLPEKVTLMVNTILNSQRLIESYFAEGQSPIDTETRDQLTRIDEAHQTFLGQRDLVRTLRMNVKEIMSSINVTLATLRDQGISLSNTDQATLTLLRISLRNQFRQRHDQQNEARQLFQTLKGNVNVQGLDIMEETLILINGMIEDHLALASDWVETLTSFQQNLTSYLS